MVWLMALVETVEAWVPRDTFAARLALVRQRMGGWNVKRTADLCGIDDQSWRNWEAGKGRPRDYESVCAKIADATGCDLRWLMAGGPLIRCYMHDAGQGAHLDGQLEIDFSPPPSLALV